jgi:hypothetical protein
MQKDTGIIPLSQMKPLELVFLGAVALVGFVNLGFIGTIAKALYMGQNVGAEIFNGVILSLILQAVLLNTVFVWKITDKLDTKKK